MRSLKKRRKKRRTGLRVIGVMVLLICAVVSVKRIGLEDTYNDKLKEAQELEEQMNEEEQRTDELAEKKAYTQTKKYIEDVARDVLGLVYKDEIIFKQEDE